MRWTPCAPGWLGHRPEPLIRERLWSCPLLEPSREWEARGVVHEAGFDDEGRPVAWRPLECT